jgi:hypothetical protein
MVGRAGLFHTEVSHAGPTFIRLPDHNHVTGRTICLAPR